MADPAEALVTSIDNAPGYWQLDILWSVLVSADQTAGAYSLMEQLMPHSSGVAPHLHPRTAEVFYILDGELALQLSDEVLTGRAGQLVRIPPATPHAFVVTTETCRVLNLYVPAMFDDYISTTSVPATAKTVPPPGSQSPPREDQLAAYHAGIKELAINRWLDSPDLLAHLRNGA